MAALETVLGELRARARPQQLEGMARYGMALEKRLGVAVPDLRKLAKGIGKDHTLALQLWQTGIAEARILASMVDTPRQVDEAQMEAWVCDFNSWDVCDQVCMNLFDKHPLAWKKVADWSKREEEFVKRAAFALLACLAWHNKAAEDERFIALLPVIREGATDERAMVKKAVSWALRNTGKRNPRLHALALEEAQALPGRDSRAARWIAADVARDLQSGPALRRIGGAGSRKQEARSER
jgi:3-methyladenine DNA glycosylase AlkD